MRGIRRLPERHSRFIRKQIMMRIWKNRCPEQNRFLRVLLEKTAS